MHGSRYKPVMITSMHAIVIDDNTRRCVLREQPVPMPKPGEILIDVQAAGVNRADLFQRDGSYPLPPDASPIPGLEVSGYVAALGSNVTRWCEGDRVMALVNGGGYAEYVCAPERHAFAVPDEMALEDAAALPEGLFTLWMALMDKAQLQPGEVLFTHGGAGGIGSLAIQLASQMNVKVLATASSDDKAAFCEALGAIPIIYPHIEDMAAHVKALADGKGVDVILDMLGGEQADQHVKMLRPDGRMVTIALLAGRQSTISAARLLTRRLSWTGAMLRPLPDQVKTRYADAITRHWLPHIVARQVKPCIDGVFPLEKAQEALDHLTGNTHKGKLIVK